MDTTKLIYRQSINSFLKAFGSSIAEKYLSASVTIGAVVILTYLYGLEFIGFVGMYSLVLAIPMTIANSGFGQSVLRFELSSNQLAELFLISAIAGIALYILTLIGGSILSTPILADQFQRILPIFITTIVTSSCAIIPNAILIKQQRFMASASANLMATLISLLLIVYLVPTNNIFLAALYFPLYNLVRVVILIALTKQLILKKIGHFEVGQELRFGGLIVGASSFRAVGESAIPFVLPGIIGLELSGVYGLLMKAKEHFSGSLSHAIHRILYVKMNTNNGDNRAAYQLAISVQVFSFLAWASLIVILPYIIPFFSGDKEIIHERAFGALIIFAVSSSVVYPVYNIFSQLIQHHNVRIFGKLEMGLGLAVIFIVYFISDIVHLMLMTAAVNFCFSFLAAVIFFGKRRAIYSALVSSVLIGILSFLFYGYREYV